MNDKRHEPSAHVIGYLTDAPDLSEFDVASLQCALYLSELLIWAITRGRSSSWLQSGSKGKSILYVRVCDRILEILG